MQATLAATIRHSPRLRAASYLRTTPALRQRVPSLYRTLVSE